MEKVKAWVRDNQFWYFLLAATLAFACSKEFFLGFPFPGYEERFDLLSGDCIAVMLVFSLFNLYADPPKTKNLLEIIWNYPVCCYVINMVVLLIVHKAVDISKLDSNDILSEVFLLGLAILIIFDSMINIINILYFIITIADIIIFSALFDFFDPVCESDVCPTEFSPTLQYSLAFVQVLILLIPFFITYSKTASFNGAVKRRSFILLMIYFYICFLIATFPWTFRF